MPISPSTPPFGRVRIAGSGNDKHGTDGKHHLRTIDPGGNGRYYGGAASSDASNHAVSVIIDAAGDDRYRGDTGLGEGGRFGTGIHTALAGNDEYRLLHKSLGYGGTFGASIAVNLGGNDRYLADVENIRYSWFDDFCTQLDLPLGFGFGRRADMSDGHSSAGGLGMLVDGGGGDDVYICSDSAFGIGNLNSLAVCWDKSGNDTWIARSNSFGQPYMEREKAIRDFPVNCVLFLDGGGHDRYLKLPENVGAWKLDARALPDLEPWEFIRDGASKSWRSHIPMPDGTVIQPGSSGAAIDSGG